MFKTIRWYEFFCIMHMFPQLPNLFVGATPPYEHFGAAQPGSLVPVGMCWILSGKSMGKSRRKRINIDRMIEHWTYEWMLHSILILHFSRKKHIVLVGGDWNHGILKDFPFSWECHHPNWLSLTPSFFRGVGWNHQPDMVKLDFTGFSGI